MIYLDLDTRVKVLIEMIERPGPLTSKEYTKVQAERLAKKCLKAERSDLADELKQNVKKLGLGELA